MKPKVLFTDGEGPIVFKDLAADMMEKIVPGLFPVLSFYDDYLVEIGTKGYQAGDNLALVVPYFLAHGVRDEDIAAEAKDAKVCSGVKEYIAGLKKDGWEIRIISTAYSQMWELIGRYLDIPMEHIACTKLDIANLRWRFWPKLNHLVESAKQRILSLLPLAKEAMIEVDQGRSIVDVLGKETKFSPLLQTLGEFYWTELPRFGYQPLEVIQVMGGRRKIEAARQFAQDLDVKLSDVVYVGDSITDDALHAHLKKEGGLPIAVNGNSYALRNAVVAVATRDMRSIRPILDAWWQDRFEGVQRFVEGKEETSFLRSKEGPPILEIADLARYDLIDPADQDGFARTLAVHKEFRKLVRGAATARLG